MLLARIMGRRAGRPRSTFTRTTVALTVLSLVPDVLLSTDAATKLTLVLTHLVAAAIVIPALATRLPVRSTADLQAREQGQDLRGPRRHR